MRTDWVLLRRGRWMRRLLVGVGLAAVLLLVGCGTELPDDGTAPSTSPAQARTFIEKAMAAGQGAANTGRFQLTVTEGEVNSFLTLALVLRRQARDLSPEELDRIQEIPELEGLDVGRWRELFEERDLLPGADGRGLRLGLTIAEPVVFFRGSGDMIVRGKARLLVIELPLRVMVAPRASEGELVLDFVEGQIGPLPMPEILFDYLGRGLARSLVAGREYAEITEIRVGDGQFTVAGRWNQ